MTTHKHSYQHDLIDVLIAQFPDEIPMIDSALHETSMAADGLVEEIMDGDMFLAPAEVDDNDPEMLALEAEKSSYRFIH